MKWGCWQWHESDGQPTQRRPPVFFSLLLPSAWQWQPGLPVWGECALWQPCLQTHSLHARWAGHPLSQPQTLHSLGYQGKGYGVSQCPPHLPAGRQHLGTIGSARSSRNLGMCCGRFLLPPVHFSQRISALINQWQNPRVLWRGLEGSMTNQCSHPIKIVWWVSLYLHNISPCYVTALYTTSLSNNTRLRVLVNTISN